MIKIKNTIIYLVLKKYKNYHTNKIYIKFFNILTQLHIR